MANADAIQLLFKQLEFRFPQSEIVKLVNPTQGQPYIIDLLLLQLQETRRPQSLAELQKLIPDNIQVAGHRNGTGQIITPENPVFHERAV
jgi:hypothetical protein